jgi:hypothetical protein
MGFLVDLRSFLCVFGLDGHAYFCPSWFGCFRHINNNTLYIARSLRTHDIPPSPLESGADTYNEQSISNATFSFAFLVL